MFCFLLGTIDELKGSNTKHNYKGRGGQPVVKIFSYRQLFLLHLWCRHQVENHNTRCHYPILVERTQDTKFWTYLNFEWYLVVTEMNTVLASGHFQHGGNIMPTLNFQRQLAIHCMENITGTEPGDIGRHMWACRRQQTVEYHLEKEPNYRGKWIPGEKIKVPK